ncbi:2-isopropylmalate synthase [Butyrivibrio sp. MC2013]|uniref:2-isopropylmalate synthase n=1 Tax=Butyrivibrio sp. MC2013 TaxID=1280686 RepID=UPI00041DF068|nr:2-isopropylmalate synthase [Butyrivibrio sp. MC2013]
MENYQKYERQYFMPPVCSYDWVKKDYIDHPPIWCSVDLRDGNQALIEPMSLEEKLEFFTMLVKLGFKEIEIGFPAASETEFEFARTLIDKHMIPDDVTVQVLTQAREHIIKRTFEAVKGAPRAIVHLYNSTSVAQREQVFGKDKAEIKKIAVEGAKLLDKLAKETSGNFAFEYSPESFPGTEVDYAVEVCNAVLDVWKPTQDHKVIINIPTTVEIAMPHVFATQVEYISRSLKYRDAVTLSLHPHNDRGTGVSDAELGLLAGADRIEGTLFGNGERTGNVDIVTLAVNMFSHGVDPKLDFSHIQEVGETYERLTRMQIYERQPYAGALVFTAFSGSHQDAIAKGFSWRNEGKDNGMWTVPYLPVDPKDLGREYDGDVIRINSQSGKGGVSFILKSKYGLTIPKEMQADVSYTMKDISDREHAELTPDRIRDEFVAKYVNNHSVFQVNECHFRQGDGILTELTILQGGKEHVIEASGNGRLDAVSNALKSFFDVTYELSSYEEHALTRGSSSRAITYVGITKDGKTYWGVGNDEDIIRSSVNALCVAVNQLEQVQNLLDGSDDRINAILTYIQDNYLSVTLDDLSRQFYLSKPYLSKYIKDKSGKTFGENVKQVRLKKASSLLRNGNMKVEKVAEASGYQNVEHFNRLFKKKYGMTPVQYRTSART